MLLSLITIAYVIQAFTENIAKAVSILKNKEHVCKHDFIAKI